MFTIWFQSNGNQTITLNMQAMLIIQNTYHFDY